MDHYISYLEDTRSKTIEEVTKKKNYNLYAATNFELDDLDRENIAHAYPIFKQILKDMNDPKFWEEQDRITREDLERKIKNEAVRVANRTISDVERETIRQNVVRLKSNLEELETDPEKRITLSRMKNQEGLNFLAQAAKEVQANDAEDEDTETDEEVERKKQKRTMSNTSVQEENYTEQEEESEETPTTRDLPQEAMDIITGVTKEVEEWLPKERKEPTTDDVYHRTIRRFYEINGFGFSNVKSTEQLLQASNNREFLKQTVYNWAMGQIKSKPKSTPKPTPKTPPSKVIPPVKTRAPPKPRTIPSLVVEKQSTTPVPKKSLPGDIEFNNELGLKERLIDYIKATAQKFKNELGWRIDDETLEKEALRIWYINTMREINSITDKNKFVLATEDHILEKFRNALFEWGEKQRKLGFSSLCLRCHKNC